MFPDYTSTSLPARNLTCLPGQVAVGYSVQSSCLSLSALKVSPSLWSPLADHRLYKYNSNNSNHDIGSDHKNAIRRRSFLVPFCGMKLWHYYPNSLQNMKRQTRVCTLRIVILAFFICYILYPFMCPQSKCSAGFWARTWSDCWPNNQIAYHPDPTCSFQVQWLEKWSYWPDCRILLAWTSPLLEEGQIALLQLLCGNVTDLTDKAKLVLRSHDAQPTMPLSDSQGNTLLTSIIQVNDRIDNPPVWRCHCKIVPLCTLVFVESVKLVKDPRIWINDLPRSFTSDSARGVNIKIILISECRSLY